MNLESITFNNTIYPVRILTVKDEGNIYFEILIGDEALASQLNIEANDEDWFIDDRFFTYTTAERLKTCSDAVLVNYLDLGGLVLAEAEEASF
ncbi:MAG: hypothetical protein F6J89_12325 [Symploca sp. SIO1C4]|uniref:Uncharacterized protein n=1 Tax=Symploca sp. SIO1C4 TaxID=2607765 RepID=A0A6B3NGH4_9CYAN|nr:hypothetical protein [Symploca sp. SIO1C4]NET07801.1 hypothetical protein [Symploca sp. SIO2B6]